MNEISTIRRADDPYGVEARLAERRHAVALRIEIAALRQAAARGLDNVTVEDVALAAGVSRRTFYRYFLAIENAVCAYAKRSVDRLARSLSAGPLTQNIFAALIEGVRSAIPPDEAELQMVAHQVARQNPAAWWRAMNAAGVSAAEGMEIAVARRLAATGADASLAGLVTTVFLGVAGQIERTALERGNTGPDPDLVEAALRDIAGYVQKSFRERDPPATPGPG